MSLRIRPVRDSRPMLDGPGPVPQYDQPAPSVYPEGGEDLCRCPTPDLGPCLGDGCGVCWRTPGCDRQDPTPVALDSEHNWPLKAKALATMHGLHVREVTRHRVCLCFDGAHGMKDSAGEHATAAEARRQGAHVAGSHVVTWTHLTLSRAEVP